MGYRSLEVTKNGTFKSLGMVSYSPPIVTMAVSLAISQIFNTKEWLDLEIWVWGRSRSLKIVPFGKTYDWSAIVTIFYIVPFSSY